MTMHLALINKATKLSNADAIKIAGAVSRQLRLHFAPAWNRTAPGVAFLADESHLIDGQFPLYFLDNADVAGALGYHDVDPQGRPYGRIFVETVLSNGGTAMTGSNSVSVCASHEALELAGDEFCNVYAQANDGYSYAQELGDPVENDSYVMSGTSVAVSNFVLPEYFSGAPEAGARFDYLGKLGGPFQMTSGGYLIRMKDGKVSQIFADEYPAWKLASKQHPAARSARRMAQGEQR